MRKAGEQLYVAILVLGSYPWKRREFAGSSRLVHTVSYTAISVENLSKSYLVGHKSVGQGRQNDTFRDVIGREARNLVHNAVNIVRGRQVVLGDQVEEFWALKDVSFEVKRGEVLGIIGRNGAGKSTLLKILSRITEPTQGRVVIRGRVASLLEVGTGFHQELTGRENIYLNGAILGMTRAEILRKFDEIVAFAGIEKFLDTPVKRYSSGMYVRLAFAVAAHLEPEIMVVDEVLAVGDAEFQNKCIGKMNSVANIEGRTVLFVSHNMSVIQHLCERAILLKNGVITCDAAPETTVARHLSDAVSGTRVCTEKWTDRVTTGEACITELEFDDGLNGSAIVFGGNLRIRIRIRFTAPLSNPIFGVIIHDAAGIPISMLESSHEGLCAGEVSDELVVEVFLEKLNLFPGRYLLSPWITDSARRDIDWPRMCATFDIHPAPGKYGDLKLDQKWGKVFIPSAWKVVRSC
jgi:lipopolysaccharide transport system ATP-binding protein